MNKKDFANFVKEKRKELNLTQEELAEELNVSRNVVSKWENGKRYPDMETSQLLAHVLGVTPTELYEKSSVNDTNSTIKAAYIIAPIVVLIALIGLVIIPLATNKDDMIIDTPVNEFSKNEPQYYMNMYSAASSDRYYYINGGAAVYYEKGKSNIKYLCNKESCEHKDQNCNARTILAGKASNAIWYYEDRLYMIERDEDYDRIVSYNLDGENKKNHTILNVDENRVLCSAVTYSMCFNEGYIYYFINNVANPKLYRASIEDGSKPELLSSYDNSKLELYEVTLTAMPNMVYINVKFTDTNTHKNTYLLDYYDISANSTVRVIHTFSETEKYIVNWGRGCSSTMVSGCIFDTNGNMYYATAVDSEYTINKFNVYTKKQEKFYSIRCNTYLPNANNTFANSDADYIQLQLFDGKYFYVTRGVNTTKNKEDYVEDKIIYGPNNSKSLTTKVNTNYIMVIDLDGNCVDVKEMKAENVRENSSKQSGNMAIDLLVGNENCFIMHVYSPNTDAKGLYEGNIVEGNLSINIVP